MYDYNSVMFDDVRNAINDRYTRDDLILRLYEDPEEFRDELMDELWVDDLVTGNGSGSYTFNRTKAKEYVMDNVKILAEMVDEYGISKEEIGEKFLEEDFESLDVMIRTYLLPNIVWNMVDEMCDVFNEEIVALDNF